MAGSQQAGQTSEAPLAILTPIEIVRQDSIAPCWELPVLPYTLVGKS